MSDTSGASGAGFDIRESFEDAEERMRAAFEGMMREMFFCFPVQAVEDSQDGKKVKLQIQIKSKETDVIKGGSKYVDITTLDETPIHFIRGGADKEGKGGWSLTHPIKKGDEGLVIISSRAMDKWYDKGGTQEPTDERMNHLSDVFFIPGISAKPRQLKNISTKTVQLRSDDEGGDGKPKHVIDFDHSNGTITTSVDSGQHVTVVDKGSGISHKSSMKVHVEAPKITTKGTWNHNGGLRATETIQSDIGLKAPQIDAAPGNPPDVTEYTS